MAAFVYNKLPDQYKLMFQVNFITAENMDQVRRSFPMVDGTPMLVDMQTGTPVRSGDATVIAMAQLAHQWGQNVLLAELHPSCAAFDQHLRGALGGAPQAARPAPRTPEELLSQLMQAPTPSTKQEKVAVMKQVKEMLGYVPNELIAKYSSVSHEGKLVKGQFVSPDLKRFEMTREQVAELKKLEGAPLGDP
jgi:hypothetical protein